MIELEDINNANTEEELKKLKVFLFQENMRLAQEKRNLEDERERIIKLQNDFMKDRVILRDELDELNRRTLNERKRLKEENLFFDKKMAILTDGFRNLEEDRRKFEAEKKAFYQKQQSPPKENNSNPYSKDELLKTAEILFRNIGSNPLGLRKRYKDLIKIYHPDNLFGDHELCQALNKEYQKIRDKL